MANTLLALNGKTFTPIILFSHFRLFFCLLSFYSRSKGIERKGERREEKERQNIRMVFVEVFECWFHFGQPMYQITQKSCIFCSISKLNQNKRLWNVRCMRCHCMKEKKLQYERCFYLLEKRKKGKQQQILHTGYGKFRTLPPSPPPPTTTTTSFNNRKKIVIRHPNYVHWKYGKSFSITFFTKLRIIERNTLKTIRFICYYFFFGFFSVRNSAMLQLLTFGI